MRKKHVVALSIVLVVLIAFVSYRSSRQKGEILEHEEKTSSMLVEIAKNSPTGGMAQMGLSLNLYAKERGGYPDNLERLYPKYINSKAFIDEIPWEYRREGDNFLLKKSFTRDNKWITASLDKTLKPGFETPYMAASADSVSKGAPSEKPATEMASKPVTSGKVLTTLRKGVPVPTSSPKPVVGELDHLLEEESIIAQSEPSAFSVVGVKECRGFAVEVSQRFLVWKEGNGIMGFGNVEYPDAERLTICANGQWVDWQKNRQKSDEAEPSQDVIPEPQRTLFGVVIR